uniref:Putative 8.9 kDa protein n=1 Tax=Ixodes ricinus TaxID=34613 RepID=A0A0K8RDB1_IXORI
MAGGRKLQTDSKAVDFPVNIYKENRLFNIGKCVYQGVEIAHNRTAHNVSPCESWTCDVNEGTVHIVGCVTWGAPENCLLEKRIKPHPGCCPKVVCPPVRT